MAVKLLGFLNGTPAANPEGGVRIEVGQTEFWSRSRGPLSVSGSVRSARMRVVQQKALEEANSNEIPIGGPEENGEGDENEETTSLGHLTEHVATTNEDWVDIDGDDWDDSDPFAMYD